MTFIETSLPWRAARFTLVGFNKGAVVGYPEDLKDIIYTPLEKAPTQDYATYEECLLIRIEDVIRSRGITVGRMPQKLQALTFHASFSDVHKFKIGLEVKVDDANELVDKIFGKYDSTGEVVTIPEQLGLALDVSENNLAYAAINLAITTRHMSRAQDERLLPKKLAKKDMFHWREAVNDLMILPDKTGDGYHFWGAFLVGLSREDNPNGFYGRVTGSVCDKIANNIPAITQFLRYDIWGHEGSVHYTDLLGYNIGRAMRCGIEENWKSSESRSSIGA